MFPKSSLRSLPGNLSGVLAKLPSVPVISDPWRPKQSHLRSQVSPQALEIGKSGRGSQTSFLFVRSFARLGFRLVVNPSDSNLHPSWGARACRPNAPPTRRTRSAPNPTPCASDISSKYRPDSWNPGCSVLKLCN